MRSEVDEGLGMCVRKGTEEERMGVKAWDEHHEESEAFQEGWSVSIGRMCLSYLLFLSIFQPLLLFISLM